MSFLNKVRQQKYLSFTVILFTLSIGILIGTVLNSGVKANSQSGGSSAPGATPLVIPEPVQLQNQFTALAKLLEPSVVNISTEYDPAKDKAVGKKANPRRHQPVPNGDEEDQGGGSGGGGGNGGGGNGGGNDENSMQQFFQRYFGGGGGTGGINPFGGGPAQEEPRASLGSGVIVDKNGYILTNNHVVEKATRMKVKFNGDDTEYEAKLIGTDPLTDLAVIHINKTGLTPAKIGNSDAIQVGDWAVAIGSPFGFQATVTAGIISAKQRRIAEDGPNSSFQPFLQTDAAINPGNSGGPLLNINGEVIGINTMIASRSGGYQGIGFAMPINTAVRVYNEIIKTGHVTRGSIGISLREAPDRKELLKAFGAKNGVFVEDVTAGGPAEKAGLKVEDIITSVNGKVIKDGQDLIDTVSSIPVGSKATLRVLRDHTEKTYEVTVGDREKVHAATLALAEKPPEEGGDQHLSTTQPRLGITFKNLTDGMRAQTGFKGKGGVVVDAVEPDSFADGVGLIKGDVVQSIVADNDHITINSVDDVKQIAGKLKAGESVALKVMRHVPGGGAWQPVYLAGTVPAAQ
jgi:serine protease Do